MIEETGFSHPEQVDPAPETPMRRLAPSAPTVWMIENAIAVAILLAMAILYDAVGWLAGADRTLPVGTVTAAIVLLGSIYVFALPRLTYRFWRFAVREQELLLERGIWNRVRTVVPLRRIQHLDVSQNIIEREYDLGKLIVHTAGTRSSDVVVPGLAIEEAEHLRETIKQYILEDTL